MTYCPSLFSPELKHTSLRKQEFSAPVQVPNNPVQIPTGPANNPNDPAKVPNGPVQVPNDPATGPALNRAKPLRMRKSTGGMAPRKSLGTMPDNEPPCYCYWMEDSEDDTDEDCHNSDCMFVAKRRKLQARETKLAAREAAQNAREMMLAAKEGFLHHKKRFMHLQEQVQTCDL